MQFIPVFALYIFFKAKVIMRGERETDPDKPDIRRTEPDFMSQ